MLQVFCLSLFLNFFFGALFAEPLQNNSPDSSLGLLKGQEILQKKSSKDLAQIKKNSIDFTSAPSKNLSSNITPITLDPFFLRDIYLNSDLDLIAYSKSNPCKLYALLESGLVKPSFEFRNSFFFRAYELNEHKENNKTKINTFISSPRFFFKQLYQKSCSENIELSKMFSRDNLANTLKKIKLDFQTKSKSPQQCKALHQSWVKNAYTPYLCRVPKIIDASLDAKIKLARSSDKNLLSDSSAQLLKLGGDIGEAISYEKKAFIRNLCLNLDRPELFCHNYLNQSYWEKLVSSQRLPLEFLFRCPDISSFSNKDELAKCAKFLTQSPSFCTNYEFNGLAGVLPSNNCSDQALALENSRLFTGHLDCPRIIEDEGLVNLQRLSSHFDLNLQKKQFLSPIQKSDSSNLLSSCKFQHYKNYYDLWLNANDSAKWPLKVCFNNKISKAKECLPFIPGTSKKDPLAENNVITKAIKKSIQVDTNLKCTVIQPKSYNPELLIYKSGCFILTDYRNCLKTPCRPKLIYNAKEYKDLEFTGELKFPYLKSNSLSSKDNGEVLLIDKYKLKRKELRNLTEINYFLLNKKRAVIHGLACAEDLFPENFKRRSFTQCRSLPFIVHGLQHSGLNKKVIITSSIQSLYSPHAILFSRLYNAVTQYSFYHPKNSWSLYGLY